MINKLNYLPIACLPIALRLKIKKLKININNFTKFVYTKKSIL